MNTILAKSGGYWARAYEALAWRLARRSELAGKHWRLYRNAKSLRHSGNPYLAAAAGIPGWLTFLEASALHRAANEAPPGNFVEIGSFCGRSSVVLAGALEARGSDGRLWCIDPFSGAGEPGIQQTGQQKLMRKLGLARSRIASTYEAFAANLGRLGLARRVVTFAAFSQDALPVTHGDFALAFIDGWHNYENTFRDARLIRDRVTPGGFVLFHDYGPGCPGVVRAVEETFGADPRFERLTWDSGSVAVFRRIV
jgi:hypothetical protein